jgi:hypothetical protein
MFHEIGLFNRIYNALDRDEEMMGGEKENIGATKE